MNKIYCYADESGQDTRGALFIVSVVITGDDRSQVEQVCEDIERTTGKGKVKWYESRHDRHLAYIQQVLDHPIFWGKLNVAIYKETKGQDYLSLTVHAIAKAILGHAQQPYMATVLIDGLPRSLQKVVGGNLRRLGVRTRKIRGVRKDEQSAFIRLADSLCGFVRAACEGQEVMKNLFEQGKARGFIKELEP